MNVNANQWATCLIAGLAVLASACSAGSSLEDPESSLEDRGARHLHFTDITNDLSLPTESYGTGYSGPCVLDAVGVTSGGMGCMIDSMTGGVALADLNRDGWIDVVGTRAGLPVFVGVYDSNGGTYSQVEISEEVTGNGIAIGDIDGDGDADIFIAGYGTQQHFLLINDGQAGFSEQALARGVSGTRRDGHPLLGTSAVVADVDADGQLDIIVTEWRAGTALNATGEATTHYFRGDKAQPGTFIDATTQSGLGVIAATGYGFSVSVSDFDLDGHNDVLLASDYNTSLIAFGSAAGTFQTNDGVQAALTDENGMGGLVADLNSDGIDDWLVTSIFAPPPCPFSACGPGLSGNRAYVNTAGAPPEDEASALGIAAGGWGWGIILGDFDHDGHDDLVSAAGMYFPEDFSGAPLDESGYATAPLLAWRGLPDGSGFDDIEVEIGGGYLPSARSLQAADFDHDGDLDLFVGGSGVPVRVLENMTVMGCNWVSVDVDRSYGGTVSLYDGGRVVSEDRFGASSVFLGASMLPALLWLPDADAAYEIRVDSHEGASTSRVVEGGFMYRFIQRDGQLELRDHSGPGCGAVS